MGGYGSTRWSWHSTKETVESYVRLDADYTWTELFDLPQEVPKYWTLLPSWTLVSTDDRFRMHCMGSSDWTFGKDFTLGIDRLRYGSTDWKLAKEQTLRLTVVDTAIGVQRRWWICPYCGRRCKFLYCSPYTLLVRCRICHKLAYSSSQKNRRLGKFLAGLILSCVDGLDQEEREYIATSATSRVFGRDPDVSCILDVMARKPKARTREQNRVIGYIRVSTDKQSDSGAGIEAQRRSIEQECERRGLELLSVVQDDGLSGKNLNRPGIQGALAELAFGRADILMAAKLDRLSRSVRDFAELMDMSQSQGWILSVLDVAVDTSTPSGELMAGVMSQFAQFERRIIGQRTKDALAVKKAQGVVLGRRPEVSADTESIIAQMRREGATMAAIADRLNAERVPTARGGAQWYPSTVQRVLGRVA